MIAAIYTRVSTDEQARRGLSLAVQERRCREVAERDGATDCRVYRDEGATSLSLDRPALQRLLDDLPTLDAVYVLDHSRWTRDPEHQEILRRRLLAHRVSLVSLMLPIDEDTPTGRYVSGITVLGERLRVEQSRAKSIDSLLTLAESGYAPGRTPYGYRQPADAAGHPLHRAIIEPDPAAAPIVRELYGRYAAGETLTEIARDLNAREVPGQHEEPMIWQGNRVRRILENPIYCGRMRWQGRVLDGAHEPLVEAHLWRQVVRRLRDERTVHPRRRATFTPLMRCGLCGGPMTRTGSPPPYSYTCRDRALSAPADRHETVGKSETPVHAVIWARTRHLLEGPALTEAARTWVTEDAVADAELVQVRERIDAVEWQIGYNVEVGREGGMLPGMVADQNRPLLAELSELEGRRDELLSTARGGVPEVDVAYMLELADRLERSDDYGRQRQVLSVLYTVIEFYPLGLRFAHALSIPPRCVRWPTWHGAVRGWSDPDLSATFEP